MLLSIFVEEGKINRQQMLLVDSVSAISSSHRLLLVHLNGPPAVARSLLQLCLLSGELVLVLAADRAGGAEQVCAHAPKFETFVFPH